MERLAFYSMIMMLFWAGFYLNGNGDVSIEISPLFLWLAWFIDNQRLKAKFKEAEK